MKYLYEVIESEAPSMKVGHKFWTEEKIGVARLNRVTELSDAECRTYYVKLIQIGFIRVNAAGIDSDNNFFIVYSDGKKITSKGKLSKETEILIRHLQSEVMRR